MKKLDPVTRQYQNKALEKTKLRILYADEIAKAGDSAKAARELLSIPGYWVILLKERAESERQPRLLSKAIMIGLGAVAATNFLLWLYFQNTFSLNLTLASAALLGVVATNFIFLDSEKFFNRYQELRENGKEKVWEKT